MIVGFVHQVHGYTGLTSPAGQHGFMHSATIHTPSAKCRQQGGVHVDDTPPIRRDHVCGHQLQISCEHYEVHRIPSQECDPQSAISWLGQHLRGDIPLAGPLESCCIGSV